MHEKLSDLRATFDIEGPLFQNKKSRVLHHPGKSPDVLRCGEGLFSLRVSRAFSNGQDAGSASKVKCWRMQARLPTYWMHWHQSVRSQIQPIDVGMPTSNKCVGCSKGRMQYGPQGQKEIGCGDIPFDFNSFDQFPSCARCVK